MPIPKSLMDKYLEQAGDCTFFGQKLSTLSREELLVTAVMGWETVDNERKEKKRQLDVLIPHKR